MSAPRGRPLARFLAIVRPFFQSEERWRAFALLGVLVTLLLSVSGLNVLNSFVGRDFMTAIEERQPSQFWTLAMVYAGVFVASTVVAVFARFTEERLGLRWRQWLTRHLVDRYLAGHVFYRMNGRSDIDNPDQRVAEDVKTFTTAALAFLLIAVNSTITLCSFSGILWSITPWLFLAAVGYAVFGSLTTVLLGRQLVKLDVVQLKREADFRYDLIQVRTHAEPIALLRGEPNENRRLRRRLEAVVDNAKAIIGLSRNIGFFTTGFNYMIQLIPPLIVAPLYMRGEVKFGAVTQALMAFSHVMGAFSLIVQEFQRISAFGAVTERLGAVWEAIDEESPAPDKPGIDVIEEPARVAYERLTLVTPRDSRVLLRELSLEVPQGKRLLIMGPHGCGRTSLFRATAGLWTMGKGTIVRPPLTDVMFLPQQPYLGTGTLREQLLYATRRTGLPDGRLQAVLRRVRCEPILDRVGGLDVPRNWANTLSLGEQQLVAFARLLLANPKFAFLDEVTSALDAKTGRRLYEVLAQTRITYLSVAADPALLDYHDMLLTLFPDGGSKLTPCEQAASA
jgi:vitamin B12/bleomycin/antimicrobial peptide transport system ATP-binding/permease protein